MPTTVWLWCGHWKLLVHEFSSNYGANHRARLFLPDCLDDAINERIEMLVNEQGMEHFQRLADPYRDQSKLIKNVDYKIEDGLHVFSKWYLIKQGKCCNNGCSNCPY